MNESIEKVIKCLGIIHIDNLIDTEEPYGLHPDDYDTYADHIFMSRKIRRLFLNLKTRRNVLCQGKRK